MNQEASCHYTPNLLVPWPNTSWLPQLWEMNVYRILLEQPEWTKTKTDSLFPWDAEKLPRLSCSWKKEKHRYEIISESLAKDALPHRYFKQFKKKKKKDSHETINKNARLLDRLIKALQRPSASFRESSGVKATRCWDPWLSHANVKPFSNSVHRLLQFPQTALRPIKHLGDQKKKIRKEGDALALVSIETWNKAILWLGTQRQVYIRYPLFCLLSYCYCNTAWPEWEAPDLFLWYWWHKLAALPILTHPVKFPPGKIGKQVILCVTIRCSGPPLMHLNITFNITLFQSSHSQQFPRAIRPLVMKRY